MNRRLVRMTAALLLSVQASLISFEAAAASSAPATGRDLLIEHVTIVSPQLSRPLPDRNVLVLNGRIAKIGGKTVTAPATTPRLDGRGKFLTPGLMDSHVHVSDVAGLPPDVIYAPPQQESPLTRMRDAYIRQQPRNYLYFGVTQLLDLSNVPAGIAAFDAQPLKPDLFRCGATAALDGYPSLFAPQPMRYTLFPDYIFEPANQKEHPLPQGADPGAHTPEAVVDRIAASGARCVKVFIEDGFGDGTSWPILSSELLKRLRAAAERHGLPLIAHANALDMQQIAVKVPVDVLAHGVWNWGEYSKASGVPDAIQQHLRTVHAKKIGYQPTLRVMAGLAALFEADTLNDPVYSKIVPPALLEWYRSADGQWFKQQLRTGWGDLPDARIAQLQWQSEEKGARAMVFLHQTGHPLLLGSDTPSGPTYGNQPGYDTYREMQLMAKAGIPLRTIFEAATINNARQFRLEKDYGTVETGKAANLLLLEADPLTSLDAWNRIDRIILHGQVIERESLTTKSPE
jgi:imidazolonepropionase-like amidohydrolase